MTRSLLALACALTLAPAGARAQEMTDAERAAAISRVHALHACVEREHAALARVVQLIRESERQRDTASDARVRHDAERALEALVIRAGEVRGRAAACLEGAGLPTAGAEVIERSPPPDPAADSVSQTGGTVREVERDAALSSTIRVERGEQVDGAGQLDPGVVRDAVRSITPRLQRCYDAWLERGSIATHRLDLVFTLRDRGAVRRVTVERSDFGDATFERCVRGAGQSLRARTAPRGGDATYSYRLRFGRR